MDKVIFLDRDGVINKRAAVHKHITSWEDFVFLDGVQDAVKIFKEEGYKVMILTNQSCIARGSASFEQIESLHRKMLEAFTATGCKIDRVILCPHDDNECRCRKPEIGMFLMAEEDMDFDKKQSFMIGDSESDILAGKQYGISTISLGNNDLGADIKKSSLREAARYIAGR